MKILVIGSSGIVGSAFKRNQVEGHVYWFEDHNSFELTNYDQITQKLTAISPDIVINCAASDGINRCAQNPAEAYAINVQAVNDLAVICNQLEICLVHFSTDAVFNGQKGDFYTEDDIPDPLNTYSKTKHLGSQLVQNLSRKYYVFRLPILFGIRENQKAGFLERMFALVESGKRELCIADDIYSCPSFSDDIAKRILELLESNLEYGLYHLKNEGKASLYDFAKIFFAKLGVDVKINRAKAADFAANGKEPRALNTIMKSIKIDHLRQWEAAMDDFVRQF
ncbi:MAG: NAD(P)-dependent oxidoreductase [Candidatus Margulisbacteria bacterium]|nr:NAD(P)-dependent oxidoreductase [Candidatus Margulisiibacteriota bacterium]